MRALLIYSRCDQCDSTVERVFTDSWTGRELCIECLVPVIKHISLSPQSEGDNLSTVLEEEHGPPYTPAA